MPYQVRSRAILPLRFVENPHVKRVLPMLGHAAYVALASGFMLTDIFSLRCLLVGGYTGLTCFHMMHPKPLRIPMGWSAVFVAVNAMMAARIAMERWPPGMTDADVKLRSAFFDRLTPAQFKLVLELGERQELPHGTVLTREKAPCAQLYFVEGGEASLALGGEHVATIFRGGFINDVAFQQGEGAGAYGTATAQGTLYVIRWDQRRLRDELEANPTLRSSMNHILIASLVDQLLQRYKQEQQGALANEARMEDRERRQSAPHKKQGEHAPVKKRNSRLRAHVTEENFQLGLEQARVLARDKNGS